MGEGSAKNLRGESMTDVIFNGASNRKPVGQATIELLFGLNADAGTTLVLVPHDDRLAARCDRVLRLDAGRLVPA